MKIAHCTLDDVAEVEGTVVVIDVLRAFSTAAVALSQRPARYELVGDLQDALNRRATEPSCQLVGEVHGRTPPEFQHSNSPLQMASADVAGQTLVHRSTAGTQGVMRARTASRVLCASFLVANATARALRGDERVMFCITGQSHGRDGDEDRACADHITSLVQGEQADVAVNLQRVHASTAASHFRDPAMPWLDPSDVDFCTQVDLFDFAMEVETAAGARLLTRIDHAET